MSDVSKTSELIAYARRWIKLHRENEHQREAAKIMTSVTDALEQADAHIKGMTLKDNAFLDMEDRALKAEAALEAATRVPVQPSSTVDEWVYRARISILNSGAHTSPEAARVALDRMIEDHVLELEPEPVFIEKRLRNAWVPVVEAIGGESR